MKESKLATHTLSGLTRTIGPEYPISNWMLSWLGSSTILLMERVDIFRPLSSQPVVCVDNSCPPRNSRTRDMREIVSYPSIESVLSIVRFLCPLARSSPLTKIKEATTKSKADKTAILGKICFGNISENSIQLGICEFRVLALSFPRSGHLPL